MRAVSDLLQHPIATLCILCRKMEERGIAMSCVNRITGLGAEVG